MSGAAGRSGRKKFVPTPDQREVVNLLASRGISQEHIRRLIPNPQTGKLVSIKTLERAVATEIQTAKVEVKVQIARFIMDTILGRRPVDAKPTKTNGCASRWPSFSPRRMGCSGEPTGKMAGRSFRGRSAPCYEAGRVHPLDRQQ